MNVTLTVYFDGQFWIGFFERIESGAVSVSRVVFGAEQKDSQVLDFILDGYFGVRYSPTVEGIKEIKVAANPKRKQRQIAGITRQGIGAKSQQAMKLAYEESKKESSARRKEREELERQRKYELRCDKRKEKHRGH